jgi:hypothetical protein
VGTNCDAASRRNVQIASEVTSKCWPSAQRVMAECCHWGCMAECPMAEQMAECFHFGPPSAWLGCPSARAHQTVPHVRADCTGLPRPPVKSAEVLPIADECSSRSTNDPARSTCQHFFFRVRKSLYSIWLRRPPATTVAAHLVGLGSATNPAILLDMRRSVLRMVVSVSCGVGTLREALSDGYTAIGQMVYSVM